MRPGDALRYVLGFWPDGVAGFVGMTLLSRSSPDLSSWTQVGFWHPRAPTLSRHLAAARARPTASELGFGRNLAAALLADLLHDVVNYDFAFRLP